MIKNTNKKQKKILSINKIIKKNYILNKLIKKIKIINWIKKKINKFLPKKIKKQFQIINIINTYLIIEISNINWKIYIEKNKKKILNIIKKKKIKYIHIKINPNLKFN